MFASLHYISEHHANADIPGQQYHGPIGREFESKPTITNGVAHDEDGAQQNSQEADDNRQVDSPETFNAALQEIARDLVLKEQQIETLIDSLPGRNHTQEQQEERMRQLSEELDHMDRGLEDAAKEKAQLLQRVESMILKVNRV